jgi:8-hydroxy-5-deazaflavin:NADPH oxidoreductase
MTESRWVAQQLNRPVVKAFNNIYARHLMELGQPKGTPGRIALPVAGDDGEAKTVVLQLVDELGFDGVDAGGLDESWRQQPGMPRKRLRCRWGSTRAVLGEQRAKTRVACNREQPTKL